MKKIYLDNAATTPMLPEVIEVICNSMQTNIGNPSSTHQFGRRAKASIETARKNIAKHFNVTSNEIIFTSSGTEADNFILHNAVTNLNIQTIITSKIEHHAVLHTLSYLKKTHQINLLFVKINNYGEIDLQDLEKLLVNTKTKTLVSLMYINNEIGNLLPIEKVVQLCKKYTAFFFSDTVQAVGNCKIDLQKIPIDFITASAHKFHGPKGVGFAYFKKGISVKPLLHGGNQEKGVRSSTENVHNILGMEKALDIAINSLSKKEDKHIKDLKNYLIKQLKKYFLGIAFNGLSSNIKKSSNTILNVRFPEKYSTLLFSLDLVGVAVSSGSACQSGSNKTSHVLGAFLKEKELNKTSIRFSFSKLTTKDELDFALQQLKRLLL